MSDLGPGKLVRGESARVWDYTSDAHSWHQWAEATYRAADVLFNHGDPFLWFGAAVLGHQSVEMFLKAILIGTGRRVIKGDVWGHDLLDLMKQVQDWASICRQNSRKTFECSTVSSTNCATLPR